MAIGSVISSSTPIYTTNFRDFTVDKVVVTSTPLYSTTWKDYLV